MISICLYIDIVEQVNLVKLNWDIPRTSLVNLLHTILYYTNAGVSGNAGSNTIWCVADLPDSYVVYPSLA
jgi:hypothetical protein